jgi:hypothetical protein
MKIKIYKHQLEKCVGGYLELWKDSKEKQEINGKVHMLLEEFKFPECIVLEISKEQVLKN